MRGNFFATIDCKTVRTFAYSSTREQSNKRYGARRETESETGESREFGDWALRAREALTPLLRYIKPILRKKNSTVLQSIATNHWQKITFLFLVIETGKTIF